MVEKDEVKAAQAKYRKMSPEERTRFCKIFEAVYFNQYGKAHYNVVHYRQEFAKAVLAYTPTVVE